MANELQVFAEQEILGKDFKIYGSIENPLFLAKDVSDWIEHSKTSMMLNSIEEDEKLRETILTSGQNREMWFLTEDGMYEVLMQSRKPVAKEFKKQIKVIMKSIRKNGAYMTDVTLEKSNY
ncbi:Bro family antirepressor [Psychrobacillus phage Perkons]|nr:Bro family antirepressor [Psychrobacillus phage Perkons]